MEGLHDVALKPRYSLLNLQSLSFLLRTDGRSYFVTDGKAELWKDFITWYVCSQPGVATPTGMVPLWLLWGVEWFLENLPVLGYGVTREPLVSRQILAYVARDVTVKTSKIETELGYKPVVSMKEGLAELATEYV